MTPEEQDELQRLQSASYDATYTALQYDQVNHPKHYNSHPSGIECIDVARHHNFNIGSVFKYLWRAGLGEPTLKDLKKAAWYLNDEIKQIEADIEEKRKKEEEIPF